MKINLETPSSTKKFEAVTEPQPNKTRNITPINSPKTPRQEFAGVSFPN
jgi:hypothetical protein